jgi:hypothetical protein
MSPLIINTAKNLGLLIVLFAIHFWLTGAWCILAWCCAGVAIAWVFKGERLILLRILIGEISIGVAYCSFSWLSDDQWAYIAHHSSIAAPVWIAIVVAIQSLSAFLCIATTFYYSRLAIPAICNLSKRIYDKGV